jgi:DNA-binding transcriptional ArsR family regulator
MNSDPLSTTFAALADPTRRAILARLARGETSVTELAAPFDMSLPAISKHLKVLHRAGLISRGREAQWRPCRLQAAPLKAANDWIELSRVLGAEPRSIGKLPEGTTGQGKTPWPPALATSIKSWSSLG